MYNVVFLSPLDKACLGYKGHPNVRQPCMPLPRFQVSSRQTMAHDVLRSLLLKCFGVMAFYHLCANYICCMDAFTMLLYCQNVGYPAMRGLHSTCSSVEQVAAVRCRI